MRMLLWASSMLLLASSACFECITVLCAAETLIATPIYDNRVEKFQKNEKNQNNLTNKLIKMSK